MPRVKTGPYTKRRKKKWLKQAKGYWGGRHSQYKAARHAVMKGLVSAYRERKRKKRTYRALWILRINAALLPHEINYNSFIHGLKLASVDLDRKILSELAVKNPDDFTALVAVAKERLGSK